MLAVLAGLALNPAPDAGRLLRVIVRVRAALLAFTTLFVFQLFHFLLQ